VEEVIHKPRLNFASFEEGEGKNPLGLTGSWAQIPRVASLARQPRALGRNPFGIDRANRLETDMRFGSWTVSRFDPTNFGISSVKSARAFAIDNRHKQVKFLAKPDLDQPTELQSPMKKCPYCG